MRKILLIIIVIVTFLITYKFVMLNKYHVDEISLYKENIFSDTLTISSKGNTSNLFNYEKIRFQDNFSNLPKKGEFYVKYNNDNEIIASMSISKLPQYYELLHDNSLLITRQSNKDLFSEKDLDIFLKDKNINNDIDLLNYIKEKYYLNTSIFDTMKKIKQDYIINAFVNEQIFTSNDENTNTITLIQGDLTGYIYNIGQNTREIHILYGNEQYIITLMGEEFIDYEYITSLLKTISFI